MIFLNLYRLPQANTQPERIAALAYTGLTVGLKLADDAALPHESGAG